MGLQTNNNLEQIRSQINNLQASIRVFNKLGDWNTSSDCDQMVINTETTLKELESKLSALREEEQKEIQRQNNDAFESLFDLPTGFINSFKGDDRANLRVDSIEDGLITSINNLGKVDIEYISEISGYSMREVVDSLKGAIYQNPDRWNGVWYKGFETADEYLSGNLVKKLSIAKEANRKFHNLFKANEEALRRLIPKQLDDSNIYITLGSPWVPPDIIDDFIAYIAGKRTRRDLVEITKSRHDPITGLWEIPCKTRFKYSAASVRNSETFGTPRMGMLYLLEATLNMRTPVITDEVPSKDNKSQVRREVNQKETMLAIEKQNVLNETFKRWVWGDEARKKRLIDIYNETFTSIRKRNFNGSYLTFPGMESSVKLYPYQKDAVARILFSPNTLLAHDVGSGKTYVMIAAGMEMRRLGMSKKNLYVVPNNLISQWKSIFYEMYPNANLLVVEPKNFTKDNRNKILRKIAKGDFDGILMAYSCFDMLPLSEQYYKDFFNGQAAKLQEARKVFFSEAPIDRRIKKLTTTLSKISSKMKLCEYSLCFDDLGINTMFVDEAHNYKNVTVDTKITGNHSISTKGSEKCNMMLDKVRCIQRQNGGRGVVFATGTPITNSVTDIFVMQQYLQSGELALLGLQNFDAWVGMFAERVSAYEIDIDTNSYHLATRFSRFHNLPELTSILASIADFHQVDLENGIPVLNGYSDKELKGSIYFKEYLSDISKRADNVRKHGVDRKEDNLLKITTDGRKAALDMRLINSKYPEDPNGKVEACAKNVVNIYKNTKDQSLTQLVFCDSSTPKAGFNIYDELRKILVARGVKPTEIEYIHNATTEAKREKLFKNVREGKVRILIGSTFKLGLGVNVQDRLIAIHHLDLPWRPADMVQREGRILRQGNLNPEVQIYRYITKGSFDAYSWQLLENKQRFISQLLSGSVSGRNGSDVDETVLNYAEIKALAVGNNIIKKRCEISNELEKERIIQKEYIAMRERLMAELEMIPSKIKREKELILLCEKDKALYLVQKKVYTDAEAKEFRSKVWHAIDTQFEKDEETFITNYQGFDLYVPAYMKRSEPKLLIKGNSKYYLELGKEAGVSIKLNNFLDNLDKKCLEYKDEIKRLKLRERAIKEELSKDSSHEEIINKLFNELNKINEELGLTDECKCS